jgi:RNA polymerase sigma factor (sigma-70 family)
VEEVGHTRTDSSPAARAVDGRFEEFAQRHYQPLARALAVMTLDKQLAADAAQEAFLRLHLRWDTRDELDDPVAWLYRVGINRCYDYRRQLGRAAHLFDRLAAKAPAENVDQAWLPEFEFTNLVKQLPKQQRIAAVLFYQGDLSTAEIARVMQISEGAVKSHLFRAREALRPLVEAD